MQRLSALIVADEENAGLYRSLLLKGERTEECALKDAVDFLSREKTDVVVLDCGNRVWTGLSTIEQLKKINPEAQIIFLTDMSSEDAVINAYKMGAREYFKKPVNILELKRTIERLLSSQGATDECPVSGAGEQNAPCIKAATTDKPQNILAVIAYIEANLWSPLELELLAEKANLSKFHFCRIFKRHIGMNPMKFVAALRIEHAKKLLKKNDLTVSLVANEVGFNDLSNFIRQFKKATGVTPTTYRDTAKIASDTMSSLRQANAES